jgi:hypothetical protein
MPLHTAYFNFLACLLIPGPAYRSAIALFCEEEEASILYFSLDLRR